MSDRLALVAGLTCVRPVAFGPLIELPLTKVRSGTEVPVTVPAADSPALDFYGLRGAGLDDPAKKLGLEGLPLVGVTSGQRFGVKLYRTSLATTAKLALRAEGHPISFFDAGDKALAHDAVPDGASVTVRMKADALKATDKNAVAGELTRVDVVHAGVVVGSLAVRCYPRLKVPVRVGFLQGRRGDKFGAIGSFPNLAKAFEVVNAIWAQGGIEFVPSVDLEPIPIDVAHDPDEIALSTKAATPDADATAPFIDDKKINILLVARANRGNMDDTYGATTAPSKWVGFAPKPCLVFVARMYDGSVGSYIDAWAANQGVIGFGYTIAHELGHYLELRHPLTQGKGPDNKYPEDGYSAQMSIMYNWLPCGHLLPAVNALDIPASGRRHGSVKARETLMGLRNLAVVKG